MKAILIKDDREIIVMDVNDIRQTIRRHLIGGKSISIYEKSLTAEGPVDLKTIEYELIKVRQNGDLVYRLRR